MSPAERIEFAMRGGAWYDTSEIKDEIALSDHEFIKKRYSEYKAAGMDFESAITRARVDWLEMVLNYE